MSDETCYLSISELTQAYTKGELSPLEVAKQTLERLHSVEPFINAFSQLNEETTLEQARASEARWRRGEQKGVLDGVLYSVKDTLAAKGFATRRGSKITSDAPAQENAPIVQRMVDGGAIILGITTTPEFGGGPVTISPLSGITRNAWNPDMTSGGSSGGAGASIASGIGQVALATDAGGSIRIPAALNGIVGVKATGCRVPTYPGNVAGGLSSPGPLVRRVRDAAVVMNAIARPDYRDPDALPDDGKDYLAELEAGVLGLKIAYSPTLGYADEVDPEVAQAVEAAVETLAGLGAHIEEVDPPMGRPMDIYKTLFTSGFVHALSKLTSEQEAELGRELQDILQYGRTVTLSGYMSAHDERRALALRLSQFHLTYDLLVTPSVAVPAFPAELRQPKHFEKYAETRAWVPFGFPFNLTQQPAASIPCGFSSQGLPIGMQIVGPRFGDALVLRAARAYEMAAGWADRRPAFEDFQSGYVSDRV
ncbi:amidase [Pusillimonas noertemannii]|uniref:amidase n=1 Tax=Pusillimonas noertemannii TaxID=305977 RepID=UPI0033417F52